MKYNGPPQYAPLSHWGTNAKKYGVPLVGFDRCERRKERSMLTMTEETRSLLAERCPDIPQDREHLNDLLDFLDALMLDSLTADGKPTAETRPIERAYDDLYYSNS